MTTPDVLSPGSVAYSKTRECPVLVVEIRDGIAAFLRLISEKTARSFELSAPIEGCKFLSLTPSSDRADTLVHLKFFPASALRQLLELVNAPWSPPALLRSGKAAFAVLEHHQVLVNVCPLSSSPPSPLADPLEDQRGNLWYARPSPGLKVLSSSTSHVGTLTLESFKRLQASLDRALTPAPGDLLQLSTGSTVVVLDVSESTLNVAPVVRAAQEGSITLGLGDPSISAKLETEEIPTSSAMFHLGTVKIDVLKDFNYWLTWKGAPAPLRGSLLRQSKAGLPPLEVVVLDFPPASPSGEFIGLKVVDSATSLAASIAGRPEIHLDPTPRLFNIKHFSTLGQVLTSVRTLLELSASQVSCQSNAVVSMWVSNGDKTSTVKGLPVRRNGSGGFQCLKLGGDHRFGLDLETTGSRFPLKAHTSIISFSPTQDAFYYEGESLEEASAQEVRARANALCGPSLGDAPLEEAHPRFFLPSGSPLPMVGHVYEFGSQHIFVTGRTTRQATGFLVTPRSSLVQASRSFLLPSARNDFQSQMAVTELPVELPVAELSPKAFPATSILPEINLRGSLPLLDGGFEPFGAFGRSGNQIIVSWDIALEERAGQTAATRVSLELNSKPRNGFVPLPGWAGREPFYYRPALRFRSGPIEDLWGFFGLNALELVNKDLVKRMAATMKHSPHILWAPVKFANGGDIKVRPVITYQVKASKVKALVLSSSKPRSNGDKVRFPFGPSDSSSYIQPVSVDIDLGSSSFKVDRPLDPDQVKALNKALSTMKKYDEAEAFPSWRSRCEHFYDISRLSAPKPHDFRTH